VWDLPATTIKNASVVVGKRLSQEKMVPFKVRIHVTEAILEGSDLETLALRRRRWTANGRV
jgi:hypothetical protein